MFVKHARTIVERQKRIKRFAKNLNYSSTAIDSVQDMDTYDVRHSSPSPSISPGGVGNIKDKDCTQFEGSLDKWTDMFKKAITSEFLEIKGSMLERHGLLLSDMQSEFKSKQDALQTEVVDLTMALSHANFKIRNLEGTQNKLTRQFAHLTILPRFFLLWRSRLMERRNSIKVETIIASWQKFSLLRRSLRAWQSFASIGTRKRLEAQFSREGETALTKLSIEYEKKSEAMQMRIKSLEDENLELQTRLKNYKLKIRRTVLEESDDFQEQENIVASDSFLQKISILDSFSFAAMPPPQPQPLPASPAQFPIPHKAIDLKIKVPVSKGAHPSRFPTHTKKRL